jgi:hypothetical protein
MAVGVQVPPSAPSNEKPQYWGFFVRLKKGSSVLIFWRVSQVMGGKLN